MIILLIIVALVLALFLKPLGHYISIIKYVQQLPGPPCENFLHGNITHLYGPPEKMFKTVRKWGLEYYPIYQNWIAHVAVANVMNPYDFETILSNMKHTSKSMIYDMLHCWLGTGLLTSDGIKWQTRRKILTPAFHFNILQEFIKIFNEETETLVQQLKKHSNSSVDVTEYISAFTLNTIGETAMGTSFGTETSTGREYKKSIQEIGEILKYKLLRPWLLSKFVYVCDPNYWKEIKLVKILHNFTNNVIANRQSNFKPVEQKSDEFSYSRRKRMAMLDLLLTAKNEDNLIDDEGIREEVDTFMFEGHDTTAVAICFALMCIACHPDIQERIFEEIEETFSDDTKPDYKSLQELKYMERCIKEVLRLYPSVPFIARSLGEDIVTYSGHKLKAGSMVHLHIYDMHHNPQVYPDPEKFDPDRFLPENCLKRHNFAYVPFSAGPRNCIGQKFAILEMKAVLVGILKEFTLEPVDCRYT
ncbi:cytochrome P450 monooxigenase CYP4Q9 [Tribolium castaneum]|uniref:Cytochrome P450-like protein n=1 Tax=Tribolium castaneum TaxID=7070 RepID=D6X2S7_TRICA|nr:cytochrome P450 monooxigenase CYP4Q9 [Tribolium castaneum]EFA10751.1 cytochrome P450-like protein [Tribolium castaneum]|eukprot:NP_001107850.1 cytochrome P450 monooxigenase CYP4Q9 [Tribolium castaneum]